MQRSNVTQDAAVRLMLKFPFWSELYYTMTVYEDESCPTLATDGRNLWVNPTFWATLPLDLKIAAVAHEVGHKMLLHVTRRGSRHPKLWNMAADFVVNGILKDNGFSLGEGWLFDPTFAGMSTEEVYHLLEQKAQQQKGGKGASQSGGTGVPQSWHDKWQDIKELTGTKEEIGKTEQEFIEQVQKAILSSKACGHGPAGMSAFEDVCEPSREPWYNHLHRFMQSLSVSEYNWAKFNRRTLVQHQMFAPHIYSESLGCVVLAIDCSGSVFNAAAQANFAGHVNAIMAEAKPAKVHILYFDSEITQHDELDPGTMEFSTKPKGGGGTSFVPIFKFIEEHGLAPEVAIILTDCFGTFPAEAPEYPVMWASICDEREVGSYYPVWGEFIYVDPDA